MDPSGQVLAANRLPPEVESYLAVPLRKFITLLVFVQLSIFWQLHLCPQIASAAGREVPVPDSQFQPIRAPRAVTIRESVEIALRNYPTINNKVFKLRAAKANVKLAKLQYLPNLNIDLQEDYTTPNRIAGVVMNNVSGFDTVPVDSGPVSTHNTGKPDLNSLQGLNFNWLLVDQGLRKANDKFAESDARIARADINLTKLDVAYAAASAFLDATATKQTIISTTAALEHMEAANLRAKTLVAQGLKAGAETADWAYEVAKARINLIKAERDTRLALVELAEKMGLASQDLDIISTPLISNPTNAANFTPTDLSAHPIALMKTAEIGRWRAKQHVLDKAYRPHLWLNASMYGRGSNDTANAIKANAGGFLPQVGDYMVGLTYSFPIMEYFPLKAQKDMARSNELAAQADFDLAMQVLEKKDVRSRVLLAESRKIADQTPLLVEAARVREIQVSKRYSAGLTNMVSLAAAEKALAEAQIEDAVAQVDVWRSILALSYVQGDLSPFLRIVEIADGDTARTTVK